MNPQLAQFDLGSVREVTWKSKRDGLETLRSLPTALQRRVIMAWLREQSIADIGFDVIERVRSLLDAKIAKINLPRDRHARRRGGSIFVE